MLSKNHRSECRFRRRLWTTQGAVQLETGDRHGQERLTRRHQRVSGAWLGSPQLEDFSQVDISVWWAPNGMYAVDAQTWSGGVISIHTCICRSQSYILSRAVILQDFEQ